MTNWQVALLVGGIIAFDTVVVAVLLRSARAGWNSIAERFGQAQVHQTNESRRFQSFKLGILNLGFSVHVTVDQDHLHLRPVRLLRWLGLREMSVPWDAIELKAPGMMRRYRTARLGVGQELTGPAWCMELAEG